VIPGFYIPSRSTGLSQLTSKGKLIEGAQLSNLLKTSKPVFPEGAPAWYPQFSHAVYTNLHAAATGSMSVAAAITAIANTANQLSTGS